MLTDIVFWAIIYPFTKGYKLSFVSSGSNTVWVPFFRKIWISLIWSLFFLAVSILKVDNEYIYSLHVLFWLQLDVCMHSLNAVFLLGDTSLNSLVSFQNWSLRIHNLLPFLLESNGNLLSSLSSDSHCSGLLTLYFGAVFSWLTNG